MNPWKLIKIWLKNTNSLCHNSACQSQTMAMRQRGVIIMFSLEAAGFLHDAV